MRVPTIIVLLLILLIAGGALALNLYQNRANEQLLAATMPFDIQTANVTDTEATVIWQTLEPTQSKVVYGKLGGSFDNLAVDERGEDRRQTHFVTLTSLSPNTTYQFKISADDNTYPTSAVEFKTSSQQSTSDSQILSQKIPIQGSVVESAQKTVDESLVVLKIPGASTLATYTGKDGNFLLPLKELRKEDLQGFYNLTPQTAGTLFIQKGDRTSIVQIILPSTFPIPTVILGQNIDLREYLSSPSAKLSTLSFDNSPYDLNSDGRVNSLDLAFILDNLNKSNFNRKADLNNDGRVTQTDVERIRTQIN